MKLYLIEKVPLKKGTETILADVVQDLKGACTMLGVSERTFYRHLEKGESKGYKISNMKPQVIRVYK